MKSSRTKYTRREDRSYQIEVHAAGFCFRTVDQKAEILVAKRSPDRELFPGKWECGGGQVHPGENFEEALKRQYFEEFGIRIRVFMPLIAYEIMRAKGPKIPGIAFLCGPLDEGVEEITLNNREFSEYLWATETNCQKLKMISGVQGQVKSAFVWYRRIASLYVFKQSGQFCYES